MHCLDYMLQLGVDLLKNTAGTQLQCNIEVKLDFLDAAIEYQLISRYLANWNLIIWTQLLGLLRPKTRLWYAMAMQ